MALPGPSGAPRSGRSAPGSAPPARPGSFVHRGAAAAAVGESFSRSVLGLGWVRGERSFAGLRVRGGTAQSGAAVSASARRKERGAAGGTSALGWAGLRAGRSGVRVWSRGAAERGAGIRAGRGCGRAEQLLPSQSALG